MAAKKSADPLVDGPRVEALQALRKSLAESLNSAETNEMASLSKEYRATLAELESLAVSGEGSKLDDLAKRRVARRTAPADSAPTSRRGQPRRRGRNVGAG